MGVKQTSPATVLLRRAHRLGHATATLAHDPRLLRSALKAYRLEDRQKVNRKDEVMTDSYAGSGEEDLGIALARLQAGDRVFITYADYAERYPNEVDELRMSELTEFAEGYGCKLQRVDDEKRIYFSKTSER